MSIAPLLVNGAFGGISDDKFIGISNSFQDMRSLEVRKYPKSLKLQYALVKDSGAVVVDKINCALTVFSTGDIMAFGDAGNVYWKHSGTRKKVYTHAGGNSILGCAEVGAYIYRATAAKLHRVATSAIADPITPTLDYQTFTAGNTNYHPMIVDSTNTLLIGDGKYVATLDTAMTWSPTKITFSALDEVVKITYNNSYFRVYCNQGSKDYGMLYFWDGILTAPSQIKELTGKFRCCATKDDVDYVILGNDPILYYYPFQKQSIKRIPNLSAGLNTMIVYKNYLTFGTPGGVYTWGNYHKDYPEVLNVEYNTSNSLTDEITCIWNSQGDLYVAWKNGTSYGVDKLSTTTYALQGYATTKVYYGTEMWRWKGIRELRITHKPLITGESIKIYTQHDLTGGYTLKQTINNTNGTYTNTKRQIPLDMNELEVKFELNGPGTSSPEIYEAVLLFDQQETE